MGEPFAFQHAAPGTFCRVGDTLVGGWDLRRDELFSRTAHTRDRTQTRRRRTTTTGAAADSETGITANNCRCSARTRGSVCFDASTVRTAVWRHGGRRDNVRDDLAVAGDCFVVGVLSPGATCDANRSAECVEIRVKFDLFT